MLTLLLALIVAIVLFVLLLRERSLARRRREQVQHELVRSLDSFEEELTTQLATHTVPKRIMEHLRTSLAGQSEQFAAFHEGFSYDPKDARFLGSPIDFVVFRGRSDGTVREVVFLEVKQHPNVTLTPAERSIREAVSSGHVRWERLDLSESAGITTEEVRRIGSEAFEADIERSIREHTRDARERLIERITKHL